MSWLARIFVRGSGPEAGTPGWRVQEAYLKMGEAGKRGDVEGRNAAYQELAAAAAEGQLLEVMQAVHAIDASLDDEGEDSFRQAMHQLTIAVYNLKHLK